MPLLSLNSAAVLHRRIVLDCSAVAEGIATFQGLPCGLGREKTIVSDTQHPCVLLNHPRATPVCKSGDEARMRHQDPLGDVPLQVSRS